MSAHSAPAIDASLRTRIDRVQLSRADREAALRQLRFADAVAQAITRAVAFLRRLTAAQR